MHVRWLVGSSLLLCGAILGCAEGLSDSGEEDSSLTSGSGAGGMSSASGPTSGAGAQGTPASGSGGGDTGGSDGGASSASGGQGSGGEEGGSGGGGSSGGSGGGLEGTASTVLSVFAGANSSAVIGNSQDLVTNMGWGHPFNDQTAERIGLVMTTAGHGIAVARSLGTGELRYAIWNTSWYPGFGSPLQPVQANLTILGGPAIVVDGPVTAHVVYQRTDTKFYFATVQTGTWNPIAEPMGTGVDQSTGLAPPAIALAGGDPIAFYIGADGDLYHRTRTGGVWQAPVPHGLTSSAAPIAPAVVALESGPELLVVFADAATNALAYTTLSAGTWSAPATIPSTTAADVVSIAALPVEGAVIGFRRTGGTLGAAVFAPGETPPWSEPPGLGTPAIMGVPAVASGAIGARAELIYVDPQAIVYASRLVNGTWTAPVFTGSSGERVAIVTGD